jgi:hypothetical protein
MSKKVLVHKHIPSLNADLGYHILPLSDNKRWRKDHQASSTAGYKVMGEVKSCQAEVGRLEVMPASRKPVRRRKIQK